MRADWNQLIPTRKSLLSRIKHWDDQKSWQDFYDTYSRLIYGAAIKAGLTEAEAEDALQETVIAVAKGIPSFKYEPAKAAFKTWLHSITKRQVANQFRKRQSKGRLFEALPGGDGETVGCGTEIPDPAGQALDELWEKEWEQNLLDAAAERLKRRVRPAQFAIYDYHVLQGHSVVETARTLGVNPGRVYLATHRMSKLLREEVASLRTQYV